MSIELYLTFLAAVALLALTPGPAMALLISNSVSFGARAGLLTGVGNALGLMILVSFIVVGLTSVVQFMADWFDWIKVVGAAYLIWLGISKFRTSAKAPDATTPRRPKSSRSFFLQGMVVALSNPKVLLFLAAFFPQFLSANHDTGFQLIIYGISFVVVISSIDFAYVLATAKTKTFLSTAKMAMFDKISGVLLMCGGVWLLFARRQ